MEGSKRGMEDHSLASQPYFSLFPVGGARGPPTGNKEKYGWHARLGGSEGEEWREGGRKGGRKMAFLCYLQCDLL